METRAFQEQQKKGNWGIYLKVITEQKFKKILMWSCKKNPTYGHNFWCTDEGYLHQKHIQNL